MTCGGLLKVLKEAGTQEVKCRSVTPNRSSLQPVDMQILYIFQSWFSFFDFSEVKSWAESHDI